MYKGEVYVSGEQLNNVREALNLPEDVAIYNIRTIPFTDAAYVGLVSNQPHVGLTVNTIRGGHLSEDKTRDAISANSL